MGATHQLAERETQNPGRMQSHLWPRPTPDSRPRWRQRRRAGQCQRVARRNPGEGRAREMAQGPVGPPWPPPPRHLSLPGGGVQGGLTSPSYSLAWSTEPLEPGLSKKRRQHVHVTKGAEKPPCHLGPAACPFTPRPGEVATLHASRILGTTCLIWITYDTFPLWRPVLGRSGETSGQVPLKRES